LEWFLHFTNPKSIKWLTNYLATAGPEIFSGVLADFGKHYKIA